MQLVQKLRVPLTNGAAEALKQKPADSPCPEDQFYLPDFTATSNVVILLVGAQLVALLLSLSGNQFAGNYFNTLARISLLVLWLAVSSAWLLSIARPLFCRFNVSAASVLAVLLVAINTVVSSEVVYWFGTVYGDPLLDGPAAMFPQNRPVFVLRNLLVALLVVVILLRYFYVSFQWKQNVERAATSRFNALQARIRPHFLFNSLNTIASLTRSNPAAAEEAIEDLADLFRASLGRPGQSVALEDELDVVRVYERMERQRLGSRLTVNWRLEDLPLETPVPSLTIQPLLENAIYHGIEPLADGGVVDIAGECRDDMVLISVTNPLAQVDQRPQGRGHQLALDNIRQRLELLYGNRAQLEVRELAGQFSVLVGFPKLAGA